MNILVVEDELKLASLVQRTLQSEGYQCEVAHDGEAGLQVFREHQPDLVILDIGLPKLNGLDVCTRIRHSKTIQKDPYILMLTGKGDEVDRIIGLHTGADDYMVKPFSLKELAARVFALLRRDLRAAEQVQATHQVPETAKTETAIITDHFFIEPEMRQVIVQKAPGGPVESVELTTLEFELLYTLAKKPGRVWTRTQLLDEIRGIDYVGDDRTIDGAVKRLRPKISPPNDLTRFIKTHIRLGYSFEDSRPR